ncbi:MAG TPA: adenylate/guanylate cyclase domain-containing protein [Candidatus Limnocylindria bacterium]|nr:adenylate/guanylate cyclase domain-containing protein [Candidatus Limnocylindria bacterium]
MRPPVLYAMSGDLQIAYSVLGHGPVDLVWTPGFLSHIEKQWEDAHYAQAREEAAKFARVIIFDKRGTGMSDRPAGIPDLEERIDDIRAVMDAAKSERAHLLGISEGVPMSILFAATYPSRIRSLILYGGKPKLTRGPDYPWGATPEQAEQSLQQLIARGWQQDFTTPDQRAWLGPGLRDDPAFLEWYATYLRTAATPAARIALSRMNRGIDVRDILSSVRVPTLIIGKTGDPVMPPDCARDFASRIPGARLVQIEAEGHMWGEATGEIVDTIREWVTAAAAPVASDRFLATILFVDLVGSTQHLAQIGDAAWRDKLNRYYTATRRHLAMFGGTEVDTAGDGLLAHFDGPGRAIRCANAIERSASDLGLEARAGVHTGEVERAGAAIRGIAVHTASRVASLAGAREVFVTSTVRDLVAGSGLEFTDKGTHELKGVPGTRQVLAVASA